MNEKTRFKILARDNFTCRYCGGTAPTVILEVDHILPASKGGLDHPTNLVTACNRCNRGKRNLVLREQPTVQSIEEAFVQNSGVAIDTNYNKIRPIRLSEKSWSALKKLKKPCESWDAFFKRYLELL